MTDYRLAGCSDHHDERTNSAVSQTSINPPDYSSRAELVRHISITSSTRPSLPDPTPPAYSPFSVYGLSEPRNQDQAPHPHQGSSPDPEPEAILANPAMPTHRASTPTPLNYTPTPRPPPGNDPLALPHREILPPSHPLRLALDELELSANPKNWGLRRHDRNGETYLLDPADYCESGSSDRGGMFGWLVHLAAFLAPMRGSYRQAEAESTTRGRGRRAGMSSGSSGRNGRTASSSSSLGVSYGVAGAPGYLGLLFC